MDIFFVHQSEKRYFDKLIYFINTVLYRFTNRGNVFAMSHQLHIKTSLPSLYYETHLHRRKSFRRIHKVILFGSHFCDPKRTSSAGHKYLFMIPTFITTCSFHYINFPLFSPKIYFCNCVRKIHEKL
jgi:hypothetical protein